MSLVHEVNTYLLVVATVIAIHSTCTPATWENSSTIQIEDGDSLYHYATSRTLNSSTHIEITFTEGNVTLLRSVVFRNLSRIKISCSNAQTNCNEGRIVCRNDSSVRFEYLQDLQIENLTFVNCGPINSNSNLANDTSAALSLSECSNVIIKNVNISSSKGIGMLLHNTNGEVKIVNSHFTGNGKDVSAPHGGNGLCIVFTTHIIVNDAADEREVLSEHNKDSTYLVQGCSFEKNKAKDESLPLEYFTQLRRGRGGGLCVYVTGVSSNNNISITDSMFSHNTAHWGSGMYVRLQDGAYKNNIVVTNTNFSQNGCHNESITTCKGAGGIHVGFLNNNSDVFTRPAKNIVTFSNCVIESNGAKVGGGTVVRSSMFTSSDSEETHNQLHFINCTWTKNEAQFGSALDIATYEFNILLAGILPEPVFTNCSLTSNRVVDNCTEGIVPVSCAIGRGTMLVTGFFLHFQQALNITNNTGSGMLLVSSYAQFESDIQATFQGNSGYEGGAISFSGISAVYVKSNSQLYFIDNRADTLGGAISYHPIDLHADLSSRRCFIQYMKKESDNDNDKPMFNFSGNQAGSGENRLTGLQHGDTMYVSTLSPCFRNCPGQISNATNISDLFTCIDINIHTQGGSHTPNHKIGTCIGELIFDINGPLKAIPGREVDIPIRAVDDLEQEDTGIYHASTNNDDITVDQRFRYLSDNKVKLYGKPGSTALLLLNKPTCRVLRAKLEVEIVECPPGYVLTRNIKDLLYCVCGASTNKTNMGIPRCSSAEYKALVQHGYWVGYLEGNITEDNFVSSNCPRGFCWGEHTGEALHRLTDNGSELDEVICGPNNRTGVVCGRCKENSSVYYHSRRYKCGSNKLCYLGWLFYILSELMPTTLLFITVLTLNISFTSGVSTGFIFFAQVIDSFATNANGFIVYSNRAENIFFEIPSVTYRMFNLDFFTGYFEHLSFCLWKGANALDMIAFKYVTIIFALLLVALTILFLNKMTFCCGRCIKPRTLRSSVIHGLSAFLVVCYAQCTRASFLLLVPAHLNHRNDIRENVIGPNTFVFRADFKWFGQEHLKYALPAVACLCTIVAIPPLLLILYPAYYKLLAFCNLSENKYILKIMQLLLLEKLKPLLDSFQSCYKDNCRFFAGLYFSYRAVALFTFAFSSLRLFYTYLQGFLLLILMLHCIAQPYKNKWHNIIDTLIFTNLALINSLTILSYSLSLSSETNHSQRIINIAGAVQTTLISLPLIGMAIYLTYRLIAAVWPHCTCCKKKHLTESESEDNDLDEFPARMLEEERESNTKTYGNVHVYRRLQDNNDSTY